MGSSELDLLLSKNRMAFQWNELSRTWSLMPQVQDSSNRSMRLGQPAASLEEARAAAIQALLFLSRQDNVYAADSKELDTLLAKYRLSFHWGNPGLKWWLIGQNKGSNTLLRTAPREAKDIETAKADAVKYILNMHRPSLPQEGEG